MIKIEREYLPEEEEYYGHFIKNITDEKIKIFYNLCKNCLIYVDISKLDYYDKILLRFFNKCKLLKIKDLMALEVGDTNNISYNDENNYNKIRDEYFRKKYNFILELNGNNFLKTCTNPSENIFKEHRVIDFKFVNKFFNFLFFNNDLTIDEIKKYLIANLEIIEY